MTVSKSPEEEKREQQRMQDILVLLQHLTENEETTIKLIIECLYDVGAVNFINQKVQNDSLNQLTKNLAGVSKPIAKRYGYIWFKKNCPELIVKWLQRKVAFPTPKAKADKSTIKPQEPAPQVESTATAEATDPQAQIPPSPQPPTAAGNAPASVTTGSITDTTDTSTVSTAEPNRSSEPNRSTVELNHSQDHQPPARVAAADEIPTESQCLSPEDSADQPPFNLPTHGISSAAPADITAPADIKGVDPDTANRIATTPADVPADVSAPSSPLEPVQENSASTIAPEVSAVPTATECAFLQPHPPKVQNKRLMESFKVTALPTPLEQQTTQIRRLKTQNKILMGSLAGSMLVGGFALWQLHTTQQSALQPHSSTPSSSVPHEQSGE